MTDIYGDSGGSVLADFLERTSGPINKANIFAVVRTEEQAQKLIAAKLGVNVVQFDLADQQAVAEAIVENKSMSHPLGYRNSTTNDFLVDLVIHTAGVIDHQPLSNLIKGLGELRATTSKDVYFVHVGYDLSNAPAITHYFCSRLR